MQCSHTEKPLPAPYPFKFGIDKMCMVVAFVLLLPLNLRAELRLPAIFGSGMVLQRNEEIVVWGKGDPNESVTVEFARQTRKTVCGKDGTWKVKLAPLKTSKERQTMVVRGSNVIEFADILVGDVWLASGQSNMAMNTAKSVEWKELSATAEDPLLRIFYVAPSKSSPMAIVDDCKGDWKRADATSVRNVTAAGYYFARKIRAEVDVPIGLIDSAWGGTAAEYWTSREALLSSPVTRPLWKSFQHRIDTFDPATATPPEEVNRLMAEWRKKNLEARRNKKRIPRPPKVVGHPAKKRYTPCNMFNSMIYPIVPFGIRGVLWYQGESNRERAEQYETLLPIMIADWRQRWGHSELPFYIVQLANLKKSPTDPGESLWAELQWAQFQIMRSTINSGLAVINDGSDTSLHPGDKKKVGDRLARWALADVYGKDDLVVSGPLYREAKTEGGRVRILFDHAEGLKSSDGKPLKRFQIAGDDRVWVWAEAVIEDQSVVVSSPKVEDPVAVRYAWAGNPEGANLTNASGLPTSLFKTDDWPGLSHGKLVP